VDRTFCRGESAGDGPSCFAWIRSLQVPLNCILCFRIRHLFDEFRPSERRQASERSMALSDQVSSLAQNKTPRSLYLATVGLKLQDSDSDRRLRSYGSD
jgi:hypothetical protein